MSQDARCGTSAIHSARAVLVAPGNDRKAAWAGIPESGSERPLRVDGGLSRRNIRDLAASLKTPQFSASNRRCKYLADRVKTRRHSAVKQE